MHLFAMALIVLLSVAARSAFATSPSAKIGGQCTAFMSSPEVHEIMDYLRRSAETSPRAWADYDPSQQDYVLYSGKIAPGCILPIYKGRPLGPIKLAAPIRFPNGQFQTYEVDSHGFSISPEFDNAMRRIGIDLALVYVADIQKIASDNLPNYMLDSIGADHVDAETTVHEAFHVFGQNGYRVHGEPQPFAWPEWASPGEQFNVGPRCYHPTKDVEDAFKAEARALIAAPQLAIVGKEELARAAAVDFLNLRSTRRALLSKGDLSAQNRLAYCQPNESAMEMVEGAANWVGESANLTAGGRRPDQVVAFLNFALNEPGFEDLFYYYFGEYQLYLMWKLFPNSFEENTEIIKSARSSSQSIESRLRFNCQYR